jgi:hypothetical protein
MAREVAVLRNKQTVQQRDFYDRLDTGKDGEGM